MHTTSKSADDIKLLYILYICLLSILFYYSEIFYQICFLLLFNLWFVFYYFLITKCSEFYCHVFCLGSRMNHICIGFRPMQECRRDMYTHVFYFFLPHR